MKTRISMGFLMAMLILMFAVATGPPALSSSAEHGAAEEQMALVAGAVAPSAPFDLICTRVLLLHGAARTDNKSSLRMSPATELRTLVSRREQPRIRLPTGIG